MAIPSGGEGSLSFVSLPTPPLIILTPARSRSLPPLHFLQKMERGLEGEDVLRRGLGGEDVC